MATTKTAKKTAPTINVDEINQAFGKFSIPKDIESAYTKLYHGLRQSMGNKAKLTMTAKGETFDWKEFNAKFIEVMGDPNAEPSERKFSLEQLEAYGMKMTGHSKKELIEINEKNWKRRNEYLKQQSAETESDSGIDTEF
jgi:hypothetical protein